MNKLLKDYKSWVVENKSFYEKLKSHHSLLYTRFQPIYDVLEYLYESNYEEKTLDEDVEKIMQIGLEYLHAQFFTCKIYYEKMFDNDFHVFIKYEQVINYLFFIEDLKYELAEHDVKYRHDALEEVIDELEKIISDQLEVPKNLNVYVDSLINRIIEKDNYEFHSIIDIFVEIASTLGLTLDQDEDYILGEDI